LGLLPTKGAILINGNNSTCRNYENELSNFLMQLAEIKQVNISDLHNFLSLDHTSFTTLNVSCKHIESTDRISVSLSKNSASSFYLGEKQLKKLNSNSENKSELKDDCLKDAQNCQYFKYFSSKEKKLYTRFLDRVESNFEGKAIPFNSRRELGKDISHRLFFTLTFNTQLENYYS